MTKRTPGRDGGSRMGRLWPRWCAALAVLIVLASSSAAQGRPPYDWRHWIKVEGTCRDVRALEEGAFGHSPESGTGTVGEGQNATTLT
jgi:hypothetical protein